MLLCFFMSGQSATGSDENKTQGGRLLGMRRYRYDAALFGDAQFMRRHSLAIVLVIPAAETPVIAGVSSLYRAPMHLHLRA